MIKHLSLLFIAALLSSCFDQNQKTFTGNRWKAGDSIAYSVEFVDFDIRMDSVYSVKANSYSADLIVKALGDTNEFEWHVKHAFVRPDTLITSFERSVGDTIDYREALQINYQTNKTGEYIGVINMPELVMYINSIWDSLITSASIGHTRENEDEKVKKVFVSEPAIEATLTCDIQSLHLIFGKDSLDATFPEYISGLNNDSISTETKIKILEKKNKITYVRITRKLNPEHLSDQVNLFVSQFISDTDMVTVVAHDTAFIEFDQNTGWPAHVENWRVTTMGNRSRRTGVSLMRIN